MQMRPNELMADDACRRVIRIFQSMQPDGGDDGQYDACNEEIC